MDTAEPGAAAAARSRLSAAAGELLFTAARTHNVWRDQEVTDEELRQLYDLAKFGPTSANCTPARFVFLRSPEAKARLKPALSANNLEKTMTAPVTAIIAQDMRFYEHLPRLFPHNQSARSWFEGNEALIATTALRNSSLQGAYFILAARGIGLDCGPMSGFDNAKVDAEFFPEGRYRSNFLCNLGHGDGAKLFPRGPRLAFEEACTLL